MAKLKDVTKAQAGRLAKKAVGKARTGATALVLRAAEAVTGKAKRRKRVKVAIVAAGAIVGAAAVAAAGVRAAKAHKR